METIGQYFKKLKYWNIKYVVVLMTCSSLSFYKIAQCKVNPEPDGNRGISKVIRGLSIHYIVRIVTDCESEKFYKYFCTSKIRKHCGQRKCVLHFMFPLPSQWKY